MTRTSSPAPQRTAGSRARRAGTIAAVTGSAVLFAVVGLVGSGGGAQASSGCSVSYGWAGQSQVSCTVSGPRINSVRWQ